VCRTSASVVIFSEWSRDERHEGVSNRRM